MSELYEGADVVVRIVKKRGGGEHYGLFRPMAKNACLDTFESLPVANRVAMYIDLKCNGSYAAEYRKAAKKFADDDLKGVNHENEIVN